MFMWYLLPANTTFAFTHADTLRGSNGRGRAWWDVVHYDLSVTIDTATKEISGRNIIRFVIGDNICDSMQIDLQEPLSVVNVGIGDGKAGNFEQLEFLKVENVIWINYGFKRKWQKGSVYEITVFYKGAPRQAINPPWDGGFSWSHDKSGKPWVAVSCQGVGASVWWPCKDAQWDEPDSGMTISLALKAHEKNRGAFLKDNVEIVSNGRDLTQRMPKEGETGNVEPYWRWEVKSPINNYDVTFYMGDYVHRHDTLMGEKGKLDLDFWVLRYNEDEAREHFKVVKQMIHCFEYWMGPYPFYEDGYKLVESPYLGMEHQSAIAYGNDYKMGYMGHDRTGTGIGMNFDYIIVHESGHEWFGNNVTAKDIADNWIHEGITTYSETLFTECLLGKQKATAYCIGEWNNIRNDKPIIGEYGVNEEGSNDMYDKGTAIMHMIRQLTNDDEKFRQMLRGLSSAFYHKTITTAEAEKYIADHTGVELTAFFQQYLRTDMIPEVEYYVKDAELYYKFNNVFSDASTNRPFTLPLKIRSEKVTATISPTSEWQHIKWKCGHTVDFANNFLIKIK
ncbi:MAG: M1 family metallopeptidase [Taibaiella sp.]|nr:M1 family metallopeptidase [Taibaiella sp.]